MKRLLIVGTLIVAACSRPAEQGSAVAPAAPSSAAVSLATDVPAGQYTLDKSHASLQFRVDHLGFSQYIAYFSNFDATLEFDPGNLAASSVAVTVDPRSLTLPAPPPGFLDELLGEQWLDATQFPEMRFRSTSVSLTGANTLRIQGDLTLHGATHPVTLDATFNGGYAGHPMDPHARIGFSAHGSFNRSDHGIAFGIPAAGSKMGVSDAVEIIIELEFSGPAWTAPGAPAAQG